MKLDRNTPSGHGKYALINMRKVRAMEGMLHRVDVQNALAVLTEAGVLELGDTPETEFFAIKLKDRYAAAGLNGYASAAMDHDREYANDMLDLARRSGPNHPLCKLPD